jgi:hypothetical protein
MGRTCVRCSLRFFQVVEGVLFDNVVDLYVFLAFFQQVGSLCRI